MIDIIESTPTKISGTTSLYLSFPFNQEVINIIKSCDKYVFDKKTYKWEVPINTLAYLLDELTYVDDIRLKLAEDADNVDIILSTDVQKYPKWVRELFNL